MILQELQGHLTLLGPRLEQSLIFSGLRQRLFKGLLISATLEQTKVTERDDPFSLLYLREDRVVSRFAASCSLLGLNGNLADTVDYLLDVVRQKDSFEKESVYVMIFIIQGIPNQRKVNFSYTNFLFKEPRRIFLCFQLSFASTRAF